MKKHLLGVGAILAAAFASSLFTARRIEAQYSSPVKVVNSTSAPAITSRMDDPGRIAYQSTNTKLNCGAIEVCYFDFPVVPPGHRLAISQISGAIFLATPYTSPIDYSIGFFVQTGAAVNFQFTWNPVIQKNGQDSLFVYPVTAYLDPGDHIRAYAAVFGTTFVNNGLPQRITLTGYLLDCTAAPCAAIAQ